MTSLAAVRLTVLELKAKDTTVRYPNPPGLLLISCISKRKAMLKALCRVAEAFSAESSLKGDFIRSNMNRNGSFVVLQIPGMPGLFRSRMGSLWGFRFFFFFCKILATN